MQLLLVRVAGSPVVDLRIVTPGGGWRNPVDRPGLANVVGVLLHQDERHETVQAAERLGNSIESGAGWDVGFAETKLLREHLERGLEQTARSVLAPEFPRVLVQRTAARHCNEVVRRLASARAWARDVFSLLVYGQSPYAFPLEGTPESLRSVTRQEVVDFYRRNYGPTGSALLVAGDFEPEAVRARAEDLFAVWRTELPPADPEIGITSDAGPQIVVVDRPRVPQTQLLVGHAGTPGAHPDHLPLTILATLLGGKFTSRLNLNLREYLGLTYEARCQRSIRRGPGPFLIEAAVDTSRAGEAASEIMKELRRLVGEEIPVTELKDTCDYLLGVLPFGYQTLGGVLEWLQEIFLFDRPEDFHERLPDLLSSLTPESLLRTARNHIHPDRLVVVAVGPATKLRSQFEPLGPLLVHVPAGMLPAADP